MHLCPKATKCLSNPNSLPSLSLEAGNTSFFSHLFPKHHGPHSPRYVPPFRLVGNPPPFHPVDPFHVLAQRWRYDIRGFARVASILFKELLRLVILRVGGGDTELFLFRGDPWSFFFWTGHSRPKRFLLWLVTQDKSSLLTLIPTTTTTTQPKYHVFEPQLRVG